jgi:FAD/FMN-containing dehydrogenase
MPDDKLIETLVGILGPDGCIVGTDIGGRYVVDFSGENACAPRAVVRPRTVDELVATIAACVEAGQPLVVQGGMTGLCGGATPLAGEVAVSLELLSGIEELDRQSMTMTVLAGTPLQKVQEAAREAGLFFPLDLGARGSCTIGGNIATNAGGNQVLRFGMMRNLVLGLEAVLADGTLLSSMNKLIKNNAGYDLKQLFIGSEGTLGVIARAVLRLYPAMPARTAAIVALADFEGCVSLLQTLQARLGGGLSAFEAMWASYFDQVIGRIEKLRSPFDAEYPLYALVQSEGADHTADRERLEAALAGLLESGVVLDAAVAQSEREVESFWQIRDGIAEITAPLQPLVAFDVSVPIRDMPGFLDSVGASLEAAFPGVTNLVFGHIGDNNLHLTVTTGRHEDHERIAGIVYAATSEVGGSIAAEHGVGMSRRQYLHLSRSDAELALMRKLKTALDPNGLLNPGRVIGSGPDPDRKGPT